MDRLERGVALLEGSRYVFAIPVSYGNCPQVRINLTLATGGSYSPVYLNLLHMPENLGSPPSGLSIKQVS